MFIPEHGGAATRLRLSVNTSAKGPITMILPLLRGRFQKTMTQSLRTIAALLEMPGLAPEEKAGSSRRWSPLRAQLSELAAAGPLARRRALQQLKGWPG